MSDLDLNALGRTHLALHNLGASLGVPRWLKVSVAPENGHFVVASDKRPVHVAAAERWSHYRFGWDARVARLFRHFAIDSTVTLGAGDTVIDIGANVGEFSLGAAARGANVLAIEGDPTVFDCLRRNVADTPAITARQGLVWKLREELTFYSAPAKADSSIFKPTDRQNFTTVTLQAHPLDELADGLDGIDLIKCDAEGAEPEVLEGAGQVLKRTRQIALDTGPERMGAETGDACARILKQHGFQVSHSQKGRKITFGIRS
ncbi:MAG: FkbM family methyltransferase [Rhodobacter sp.]|nr:FkbM family methyltransferase [Rhodobacter sp.]